MPIIFDVKRKLFHLKTRKSSYQIKISELGHLLHVYYGASVDDDMSYLIDRQDRGFSGNPWDAPDRTYSLDTLPQEYPFLGSGDYRETCLEQKDACGVLAADYRYASHCILPEKPKLSGLPMLRGGENVETLEITMEDSVSQTALILQYSVYACGDILTRSAKIVNRSTVPIRMERALSCCVDFYVPKRFELMTFYGRHCGERTMQRTPVAHGKTRIDSVRGVSSPQYNPFAILCAPETTERSGRCYGFCFVYSGSFLFQVEKDQIDQTRVVMGIHPQEFSWTLAPQETFQTPEVLLSFSDNGFSALSRSFHRAIRERICDPKWMRRPRPILINNWEATYFDFNESSLSAIAREAAALGVELFVLDDGWFGERNGDTSSLGDWYVNREKLPNGLEGLSERTKAFGLKLGLWLEPEMVSPDSELNRTHPECCLSVPGRAATLSRAQRVLDMTREDVRDYLFEAICAILDSTGIRYIKWDMNRHLCEKYSAALPTEQQGEVAHRYVLGIYALLERLTARYPGLLIESCSGGGGRFDAGMLYYTPQIWCSDNTDPIARLEIQYGTSFCYPQSCISAHVSASPNHQTGRETALHTRFCVATAAGGFGYELDPAKLGADEKEEITRQIKTYQQYRDLFCNGDFYRLTETDTASHNAWMVVSPDRKMAIMTYVETEPMANGPERSVRLNGLVPELRYKNSINSLCLSGRALMSAGFVLPQLSGNSPAIQVIFQTV